MTRDEILQEILNIPNNNILLELATGVGKTRLALNLANKFISSVPKNERKILIVYPRNVLDSDWRAEVTKWNMEHLLPYITFINYASLHKYAVDKEGKQIKYTCCIFDESHHLSDLKRELVLGYSSSHNILLSATVGRNLKQALSALFKPLYIYKVPVKVAIEEDILPDPTIIKIPISLKDIKERQSWCINPKGKYTNNMIFPLNNATYWKLKKQGNKDYKYTMKGTALEYNFLQNSLIDFYKGKSKGNAVMKNIYIRMCGDRLEWYAMAKTTIVKQILDTLKYYKTLTFCTNIAQADCLSKNAIHSKNKQANEIKQAFNEGKIKHITAVDMVTEGANLAGCKFGIWARYNTSETKIPQKIGRILRHKTPYIILPYFVNTKEEEIVDMMCETVGSKDRIITTTISNLKNVIK